ncbi:unnamed protein product [Ectocarpus fasciculatus]
MGDENAMNEILRQLQEAADAAAESAPGEEMTHVSGVSFVDSVGLSLGAAPKEEAERAGAYRHIANCAEALEALVLQEDERLERESREQSSRQGGGHEHHEDYANYHQQQHHHFTNGGGNHASSGHARASTRLKGEDRHIVIQKKSSSEVAVVVLEKKASQPGRQGEEDDAS